METPDTLSTPKSHLGVQADFGLVLFFISFYHPCDQKEKLHSNTSFIVENLAKIQKTRIIHNPINPSSDY